MEQSGNHFHNPFIGLRSYQYGEQLFGREREARQLRDLLLGNRLVLLHAPSGAGKTSLVEALLRPMLEQTKIGVKIGLRQASVEDGPNGQDVPPNAAYGGIRLNAPPPENLEQSPNRYVYSVISHLEDTLPEANRLDSDALLSIDLATYFKRLAELFSEPGIDFLHFDQFEEVLRLNESDTAAKTEFFHQLGIALYERRWLAVFSIRDEYIGALEPYLRYLPTKLSARFRLERLQRDEARTAVVETARGKAAIPAREFEDADGFLTGAGLVDEDTGLVDPSILQVVCQRLWDAVQPAEKTRITVDDTLAFDASEALRNFYEEGIEAVYSDPEIGVNEQQIRTWFSKELIASHVRNTVLREDQTTRGLPNTAVEQLRLQRLIVAEPRRGQTWYELTHDALIAPILASNGAYERQEQLRQAQQAERAEAHRMRQRALRRVWSAIGLVVFVLLFILAAYVFTTTRSLYEDFPLQNGQLAYTTDYQNIQVLEGGLTGFLKLQFPILGPNPRQIAFDQHCEDGDEALNADAVPKVSDLALSADERLAFTVDGACILAETAPGSGTFHQVVDDGTQPVWSSDSRLAYTRTVPVFKDEATDRLTYENPAGDRQIECNGSDIIITGSDDSGATLSLREAYAEQMPPATYTNPAFSPDGNYIAFEMSACRAATTDLLDFSETGVTTTTGPDHQTIWVAYVGSNDRARCIVNITEAIGGSAFAYPLWLDQAQLLISGDFGSGRSLAILPLDPNNPCNGVPPDSYPGLLNTFSIANAFGPTASQDARVLVFPSDLFGSSNLRAVMLDSGRCPDGSLRSCGSQYQRILELVGRIYEAVYWADAPSGGDE